MPPKFKKYIVYIWKSKEESIFHLLTSCSGIETIENKYRRVDDCIY